MHACKILISRGYHIKLNLFGEGRELHALKKLSSELNIEYLVNFKGFKTKVFKELQDCDIFVFPSLWEGNPNSVIEAMAFGLPVISFKISSLPEVITHMKTGLLAKPKDSIDLANQIEALINSPKLREQLGSSGRDYIIENFNEEKIYAKWLEALSS